MTPSICPTNLGDLEDSSKYGGALEVGDTPRAWLKDALYRMVLIRVAEEKIADMVTAGQIVCPAHLAIGQEACAVGVARFLRGTDRAFGTHRSHSHYLAVGGSVDELFGEVLGKVTGCSRGMGGSMHLAAKSLGFAGSVPIVGATISMAVGAALAAKLDGGKNGKDFDVGVAFFGDGATEEGTFHESMNYAANFRLPMLFVCENNLFSSHLHIRLRQPASCIARYAVSHCVAHEIVDGNDVVAVANAMGRLATRARSGEGPGFLEAVTYRWRGHVGPREDIDVGVDRKKGDLELWKRRDPIRRLREALVAGSDITDADFDREHARIRALVDDSARRAEAAPYPEASALMDLVYPNGGKPKAVRKS